MEQNVSRGKRFLLSLLKTKEKPELENVSSRETIRDIPLGVALLHSGFCYGTDSLYPEIVYDVGWSQNGEIVAAACDDGLIRIWRDDFAQILHAINPHIGPVLSISWSPSGNIFACSGGTIKIISLRDGELFLCPGHRHLIYAVSWSPDGDMLASASEDTLVGLWDTRTGARIKWLEGHKGRVNCLAWHPKKMPYVASASSDRSIRIWDTRNGTLKKLLAGHKGAVTSVAWADDENVIASGSQDGTVRIWNLEHERTVNVLEGHTGHVTCVRFGIDGILASKCDQGHIKIWDVSRWSLLASIYSPSEEYVQFVTQGLAFNPTQPILLSRGDQARLLQYWSLDLKMLLACRRSVDVVRHVTAKIVLVGDSGVGKTGLGWRLAHDDFKEQPSTHGQQFWLLDTLHTALADGTDCEAVLWDLAGQPDYRLIHSLFLDDADLALIVFDPADREDPLHGVDYWLKALDSSRGRRCRCVLVGGRIDRGDLTITSHEVNNFCKQRGISGGYVATSARDGAGLNSLIDRLRSEIPWTELTATVTSNIFKIIKDYVLMLKSASHSDAPVLLSLDEITEGVRRCYFDLVISDDDVHIAINNLAKYGYVRLLYASRGDTVVLLTPDLLNNLAASFILEARRNPRGLGALDETEILLGNIAFPELLGLTEVDKALLIDAVVAIFLNHNLCFRETLGSKTLLIFPALINQKKVELQPTTHLIDDVSYIVSGAIENVYAALVVLMGYTNTFSRSAQWYNEARYSIDGRTVCGFRQVGEVEGEVEFILYYSDVAAEHDKRLFQGLFEKFLAARDVHVILYPPLECTVCGYRQERAEVVRRTRQDIDFMWCANCGEKIRLFKAGERIDLSEEELSSVVEAEYESTRRTQFESALVVVKGLVRDRMSFDISPRVFVSYAWGNTEHETWVEKKLAADLKNAGIQVVLDRWSAKIGSEISRFISIIEQCEFVIVVGTRLYRKKYNESAGVVAAEVKLIAHKFLLGSCPSGRFIPILLEGAEEEAFPAVLRGHAYVDCRKTEVYVSEIFDIILTLYNIPLDDRLIIDLRSKLKAAIP
ncbi:MAG: TIR domain-containing protein [Rhodospirillales bacterium]